MHIPLLPRTSSNFLPTMAGYRSNKNNYLKLIYHYLISNTIYILFIFPLVALITNQHIITHKLWHNLLQLINSNLPVHLILLVIFLGTVTFFMSRPREVYLVDFACCKPNPCYRTSKVTCMDVTSQNKTFTQENIEFQRKLFERSGVGDETYLPPSVIDVPPKPTIDEARKEAESLIFLAIDELLAKTKEVVLPQDVGIVIVNCSVFTPFPSLCATIVNRYKLKEDVITYNLGGMGCSAGLISVDLAKHLLQVHPNSYALIVSVESLTQNWYCGNNRSMLISNCLFRMGGAAILLSNRLSDRHRSKYQLVHVVRTHNGADDKSYTSAYQQEDETGRRGLALSKDLMAVAGEALKTNITTLGPLVLPLSEQFLFLVVLIAKKVFRMRKIKSYLPDFKLAFEHFCIHAGGRAVLDELEKKLELSQWNMEPSRMTLYRYGNTSSSSLWYELAYLEAKGRIKKGDKTWQIGFGSGFKCNSTVWHALRNIYPNEGSNPWMDEIDKFPVHVPQVSSIIRPTMG